MPLTQSQIAAAYNTLAHPRRVKLAQLIQASTKAPNFKTLAKMAKLKPAVLQHHLGVMEKGELIKRQKRGSFTEFTIHKGGYCARLGLFAPRPHTDKAA